MNLLTTSRTVHVPMPLQRQVTLLAHISVHVLIIILGLDDLIFIVKYHLLTAGIHAHPPIVLQGSFLVIALLNNKHLRRLLERRFNIGFSILAKTITLRVAVATRRAGGECLRLQAVLAEDTAVRNASLVAHY